MFPDKKFNEAMARVKDATFKALDAVNETQAIVGKHSKEVLNAFYSTGLFESQVAVLRALIDESNDRIDEALRNSDEPDSVLQVSKERNILLQSLVAALTEASKQANDRSWWANLWSAVAAFVAGGAFVVAIVSLAVSFCR